MFFGERDGARERYQSMIEDALEKGLVEVRLFLFFEKKNQLIKFQFLISISKLILT